MRLARAAYYRELALGDEADREKLRKMKAQIAAENKLILDSKSGRQVLINTKETAENKPVKEPRAPRAEKPKRERVKDTGGDEIQKEIDKARQANIDATLDAITVEKNAVEAKYADLIAKAVKYKKDTSELEILKMNELNDINLKQSYKIAVIKSYLNIGYEKLRGSSASVMRSLEAPVIFFEYKVNNQKKTMDLS